MQYATFLAVALVALVPQLATAQVFKCKDAAGKTIYSDAQCSTSQTGELLERRRTIEEKMREREQARTAQIAKEERRAREADQERAEAERRNMAATMQPSQTQHKGYAERLAEQNAGVRSSIAGGASASHGMTRAQREIAVSQATTPKARAEVRREATTVLQGAHGLTASQRDTMDRLQSYERTGALPPSRLPPPATINPEPPINANGNPAPTSMPFCAGGFCHDNQGGVYHQHGNGTTMTGPNGGTCIKTGGMIQC